MNRGDAIVAKFTSGTFWCIVLITGTACHLAIIEPSIRDAFFALAGGIIRDYFVNSKSKQIDSQPKEGSVT